MLIGIFQPKSGYVMKKQLSDTLELSETVYHSKNIKSSLMLSEKNPNQTILYQNVAMTDKNNDQFQSSI